MQLTAHKKGTARTMTGSVIHTSILETFWHTKYFTQMLQAMPSCWAAILWLFDLR
jgi:hypothetical protein